MTKILVTTDFSANSKAAVRFAIQLASQHKYELTFFHSNYILKPFSWNNAVFESYEREAVAKISKELERFVLSIYKSAGTKPKNIKCVVYRSITPGEGIMEYAGDNKFNFICISTRGAGEFKKLFGTHTSYLINHSNVPVIAVPHLYRSKELTHILYASDLSHLDVELNKVVSFSKSLKARIELLHMSYLFEEDSNRFIITESLKKISGTKIELNLHNMDLSGSLISNLEKIVKKSKPSLLIMFTENRNFFTDLFSSGETAGYSFITKVPLLVFKRA